MPLATDTLTDNEKDAIRKIKERFLHKSFSVMDMYPVVKRGSFVFDRLEAKGYLFGVYSMDEKRYKLTPKARKLKL